MEQVIVETEKFKAAVEVPPSKSNFVFHNNQMLEKDFNTELSSEEQASFEQPRLRIGNGLSDDDFFHITCHIDSNLKSKIERGEFVNLDKLLPKENSLQGRLNVNNETKLEWVQSEGNTYLVPANKASRINCFRMWEEDFRMYATIYCTKNPSRAREIWQYVSIINTASMSYQWDNVYNYDVVFRQLIEFNPARSWSVTYNQMWNLSMTNPLNAQSQPNRRNNFSPGNNFGSGINQNQNNSKKKIDYYWSFNKGIKCKFGRKCKFIQRCSYCDATSHGVINCDKLDRRGDKDGSSFSKAGGRKRSK